MNSAARPRQICSGDRPRARSVCTAATIRPNSSSERLTPRRASASSPLASPCALAAEYSHLHGMEQWYLRLLHPLQTHGHASSLRQAVAGASEARSPLPGPLDTVRLRRTSSATLDGDRPRSAAISRADLFLSSPRSTAALSARSILRYLLHLFSDMACPFSRAGPYGPAPPEGILGLIRTRAAESGGKLPLYR